MESRINDKGSAVMDNEELSIVDSFGSVIEAGAPISDAAIDWLRNDEGLRNIPFVSQAVAVFHLLDSVRERHNVRKLATFIQTVADGSCDEKKRKKYLAKWHADKNKRYTELEHLIVIIDRFLHKDMARMLARVYLAYLEERLDWQEVLSYSAVIDRLLPGDFEALKQGNRVNVQFGDAEDTVLRLVGLGLMVAHGRSAETPVMGTIAIPDNSNSDYNLTSFGKLFLDIID